MNIEKKRKIVWFQKSAVTWQNNQIISIKVTKARSISAFGLLYLGLLSEKLAFDWYIGMTMLLPAAKHWFCAQKVSNKQSLFYRCNYTKYGDQTELHLTKISLVSLKLTKKQNKHKKTTKKQAKNVSKHVKKDRRYCIGFFDALMAVFNCFILQFSSLHAKNQNELWYMIS